MTNNVSEKKMGCETICKEKKYSFSVMIHKTFMNYGILKKNDFKTNYGFAKKW